MQTVHAFTRKDLPSNAASVQVIRSKDSSTWPKLFPTSANLFISTLGSTKGAAGSLAAQRLIDYDLNLDLARAAKAAGTKVYVLLSSNSASATSMFPYLKMKGELEVAVKALEFDHTIILRPGLIIGPRSDFRGAEFAMQKLAGFVGGVLGNHGKDFWAQDAQVIARAAVSAGLQALGEDGKGVKVRELGQAEIVRLGRTEWKL